MRQLLRAVAWVWLTLPLVACHVSAEPSAGSTYVNPQFGLRLEAPNHWLVYDRSAVEVTPLLKAMQAVGDAPSGPHNPGVVAVFSEFPLGADVPFNANIVISIHPVEPTTGPAEVLLEQFATRLMGYPSGPPTLVRRGLQEAAGLVWADYRYTQQTAQRRVPIVVRLAMAMDTARRRYVLMTASCQEDTCAHYEPAFRASMASLQWSGDAQ